MIRKKILELEEEGTWIEKGKETSMMKGRLRNPKEPNQDRIEARDEVRNRVCEVWDMGEKVSDDHEVGDGLDGVREGAKNVLELGEILDGVRGDVENEGWG